ALFFRIDLKGTLGALSFFSVVACGGFSFTNQANGSEITSMANPSTISDDRQSICAFNHFAAWGTSIPPTPIPRYAIPIILPRDLSNHREVSTWLGSGPPHKYPNAVRK